MAPRWTEEARRFLVPSVMRAILIPPRDGQPAPVMEKVTMRPVNNAMAVRSPSNRRTRRPRSNHSHSVTPATGPTRMSAMRMQRGNRWSRTSADRPRSPIGPTPFSSFIARCFPPKTGSHRSSESPQPTVPCGPRLSAIPAAGGRPVPVILTAIALTTATETRMGSAAVTATVPRNHRHPNYPIVRRYHTPILVRMTRRCVRNKI